MKDLALMRRGLLREIKQIILFFQDMEKAVKSRDPSKIYPTFVYIDTLAYHMNEGDLTPLSIELKQALLHEEYLMKNGENNEN